MKPKTGAILEKEKLIWIGPGGLQTMDIIFKHEKARADVAVLSKFLFCRLVDHPGMPDPVPGIWLQYLLCPVLAQGDHTGVYLSVHKIV